MVEDVEGSTDDIVVSWSRSLGTGDRVVALLHGLGSDERDLATLVPDLPSDYVYASLRGTLPFGEGWAWLEPDIDPGKPELLTASAQAVESWMDEIDQTARVVGVVGFSQGAVLALHLMRRSPERLAWVGQLSGGPFPVESPGDAALGELRPPVFWGHGDADPTLGPEEEAWVRDWLETHTTLDEVRATGLGHDVNQEVVSALSAFMDRQAEA